MTVAASTNREKILNALTKTTPGAQLTNVEIGQITELGSAVSSKALTDMVRRGDLSRVIKANDHGKKVYFYTLAKKVRGRPADAKITTKNKADSELGAARCATTKKVLKSSDVDERSEGLVDEGDMGELTADLKTEAQSLAKRSVEHTVLLDKIDQLRAENARLDGQLTADRRRLRSLQQQNEALSAAVEDKELACQQEEIEMRSRIKALSRVQRGPMHTSEIVTFLSKLRRRPALEDLAMLKLIEDDYVQVLSIVRGNS